MRTPQQALQDALDSGAIAAFIAGKSIQIKGTEENDWLVNQSQVPKFASPHKFWRPTPLTFLAPPPSECYHNPDSLTPEQVGESYRLLLVSEVKVRNNLVVDSYFWNDDWEEGAYCGIPETTYRVPSTLPFHWDRPVRTPRAATDFIGAWLKIGDEYVSVDRVFCASTHPIQTTGAKWNIEDLIEEKVLVRLANTTDFVPCYIEKGPEQ